MSERLNRRSFAAVGGAIVFASTRNGFGAADDQASAPQSAPAPVEAPFDRDYDAPAFKPSWKKPQIHRMLVQDFVIFAHSELDMVKKLLEKEPALLNAAMDWGAGDWETGLGGASHMGRHDIVEYLLGRGARIDIFCAAMMGMLEAVKSFLDVEPQLIDAKGPHGFSLHFHAQVGDARSAGVLEYLQSQKPIELKPNPFLKKPGAADKPPGV